MTSAPAVAGFDEYYPAEWAPRSESSSAVPAGSSWAAPAAVLGADPWLPERLAVGPVVGGRCLHVVRDGCTYSRMDAP